MKTPKQDGPMKSSQAGRPAGGARRGAAALLMLTPAIARAQEEQVLFVFVFFPSAVVMVWLAIRIWSWNASRAAKTRCFFAVGLTTVAIFVLNWEGGVFPLVMRLGPAAFILGIAAQFALAALVWWSCRRREERRGEARVPDREEIDRRDFKGPDRE